MHTILRQPTLSFFHYPMFVKEDTSLHKSHMGAALNICQEARNGIYPHTYICLEVREKVILDVY